MKGKWYKKVLRENKKEIISSSIFTFVFALCILLWRYFSGNSFDWQTIEPIETPGLLPRIFYSALVFASLGAMVYSTGFYKFLYSLFRGTRGGYKEYKKAKKDIWFIFILIMFFVIIPFVVKVLNTVASFAYNIINLILYLFPPLGITLIIFGGGYLLLIKIRNKF